MGQSHAAAGVAAISFLRVGNIFLPSAQQTQLGVQRKMPHTGWMFFVDLRKMPKVTLRKLGRHQALGMAHIPMDRRLSSHIEIDSRLKGREKFETFLHEALHLALPHLSEDEVLKAARFQALVTWSEGYRHREKPVSSSQ